MMAHVSRQQRRQLERTAAGVDHITAEDRAWFEARPDRQFRIRRMAAAEIASCAAVATLSPVPLGAARFTLVRRVTPNLRFRIFIHGPDRKSGDETGDDIAAALWQHHLDRNPVSRERESAIVALVSDNDAAAPGRTSPDEPTAA